MGDERALAGPDDAVDAVVGTVVDEGDRRGLAELLTRQLAGRTPTELAGDDRIGAAFLRQTVDRAAAAILAAGWRPPAPAAHRRTGPVANGQSPALFDADPGAGSAVDSVGIGGDRSAPPGRPR